MYTGRPGRGKFASDWKQAWNRSSQEEEAQPGNSRTDEEKPDGPDLAEPESCHVVMYGIEQPVLPDQGEDIPVSQLEAHGHGLVILPLVAVQGCQGPKQGGVI